MKRAAWACCATRLLAALLLVSAAAGVRAREWPLQEAQALTIQGAPSDVASWQKAEPASLPVEGWTRVSLPIRSSGATQPAVHWYRFELPAELFDEAGPVLYLPRVIATGRLALFVDQQPLTLGYPSLEVLHFNAAVIVPITRPPPRADGRPHELVLRVVADTVRRHAIAMPWVGDYLTLQVAHEARSFLQADGVRVVTTTLALLGLFALAVGMLKRERGFILFALLTFLFFVRCMHYYSYPNSPLFQWLTWCSLAWIVTLSVEMARSFHGTDRRWARRSLWFLTLVISVLALLALPPVNASWINIPVLYGPQAVLALGAVALLAHTAWRTGSWHTGALAAVLVLNLGLGVHDLLLRMYFLDPARLFLLPFGGLAMFGVMLHAFATRYTAALRRSEDAAAVLARRLAEREAELQASHEQLRRIEQAQALAEERQRLMRDMHDGLGSTLAGGLLAVQSGRMDHAAVARLLAESVDELRLTIDSLDPTVDDPLLAVAALRYRLEPRLSAANVSLHWDLQALSQLPALSPAQLRHLLRLLQESLANVLKHAQARQVRVAASVEGQTFKLMVQDDGRGFDTTQAPAGRGLRNLERRAQALGGRLELDSADGQGTRVRLWLPLAGPSAAV